MVSSLELCFEVPHPCFFVKLVGGVVDPGGGVRAEAGVIGVVDEELVQLGDGAQFGARADNGTGVCVDRFAQVEVVFREDGRVVCGCRLGEFESEFALCRCWAGSGGDACDDCHELVPFTCACRGGMEWIDSGAPE